MSGNSTLQMIQETGCRFVMQDPDTGQFARILGEGPAVTWQPTAVRGTLLSEDQAAVEVKRQKTILKRTVVIIDVIKLYRTGIDIGLPK